MYSLPRITKQMPAALICIVVGCLLEYALFRPAFDVHTLTIHDKSGFSKDDAVPLPFFLNPSYDLDKINFGRDVIMQAVTLAVVAMLESLMCLEVMNDVTGTVGHPNGQVWALGAANVLAGLFGTMGGNSLIELCVMNVQARGTMRASSTIVALGVLAVVLFASNVLNLLPCGTLGGIMITVVLDTARWSSIPAMIASVTSRRLLQRDNSLMRKLNGLKIDPFDSFVIIVVTALTYFFNLMVSVGAGMFLATLRFAWQAQQPLAVEVIVLPETPDVKVYRIKGNVFFASKEKLASAFDFENDPNRIEIDFRDSKIYDFSVLHAFHGALERYHSMGKQVSVANLRDATHLHHLMYFGAVAVSKDKEAGITASLISGAASIKM
jgi:SulP family sulfate permease